MKSFTLAFALALLTTGAAFATPSLKGDITVNTDIVTVGDMFDNPGELSETAIFRAPAPGTIGIVPLSDVQSAAKLIGLTDFENVGYTRIRVSRPSTTVDAVMLGGLVGAELAHRGVLTGSISADTHFDLAEINFNAQQGETPATLSDLRYNSGNGSFTARFIIAGIDQPVDLGGTVQLMTTAPRLTTTQPAGAVLAATDLEMAEVPLATAAAGGYAELDQLVGKQLVRQARAGLMLKPADVADPTAVSRNALVTVLLRVGAMTLTVKGQALGTVAAGQPVDVLNTVTKKILHGVARSDGTVEIITADTTVASL
jgi:flagella basal body P-ring formation protein FlgA